MARKRIEPAATPAPAVQEKPVDPKPSKPRTKVNGEAKYEGAKTRNELIVQDVEIPFTYRSTTTVVPYLRIFVRPDEAHDEPTAQWDDHGEDELYALNTLFNTYGKGDGTELRIKVEHDGKGDPEFFVNVYGPRPKDEDPDARLPCVLVDPNDSIADAVKDLFYAIRSDDPPDSFRTRAQLEESIEKYSPLEDEHGQIESLLNEFDMPGDLPAHLYSIPERLRAIFRKAKGLS